MNILITGATGLVGAALAAELAREGHSIYRLTRPGSAKSRESIPGVVDLSFNPSTGEIAGPGAGFAVPVEAIVNLAGAPVAAGRWTPERKALLRSSRIDTTRGLVSAIAKMTPAPHVLISASAIGIYGDRGDELLTESSPPGANFLAQLAKDWEAEALQAEKFGVRVVLARFGIILAKHGGALPQMMAPLKYGLGGKLGSGEQWTSWIALQDVVAILRRALHDDGIRGPVNLVAPNPVTNAEFTYVLAKTMNRPAIFAAPRFLLRLAMGEMADGALLASQRVTPQKLLLEHYQFIHADLAEALKTILS